MTPFSSVLIVDDEPAVRALMSRWVSSMGMAARTAGSVDEALEALQDSHCDLAVVDVRMPGRNGLWLAEAMRRSHPSTAVVLATGHAEMLGEDGPTPPVADLLIKPFPRERFVEAIGRGRAWHERALAEVEWHDQLLDDVNRRVVALRGHTHDRRRQGEAEVDTLMTLLEVRLPDVRAHSDRVGAYALHLARVLELDEATVDMAHLAGRLHDIGKLAVPKALLETAAPLRPGEIAIIRRHVDAGADLLADTATLGAIAPLVYASHEWFGGGGYPEDTSGSSIPLVSRLVAVVDAFDAMTHDRAYRGGVQIPAAAEELLRCTPRQFDPDMVIPFLATIAR